jgi:hypothetical protein
VFLDESGFMLQAVCRRTWAPRGQTPRLRQWDRRDRLSAISALTVAPRRRRFGLYWALYPHNIRRAEVLRFVQALRRLSFPKTHPSRHGETFHPHTQSRQRP